MEKSIEGQLLERMTDRELLAVLETGGENFYLLIRAEILERMRKKVEVVATIANYKPSAFQSSEPLIDEFSKRSAKPPDNSVVPAEQPSQKKKRKLSPEGRAAIIASVKRRWAKYHNAKRK